MSSVKIFEVRGCHWWGTQYSVAEFHEWCREVYSDPSGLDLPRELTQVEIDTRKVVGHEFGPEPLTFREILERMEDWGGIFITPELVANTEGKLK